MSGKKAAASSTADRRSSQALELFEKAVRALGKKDYERARDLLDGLIESHPEERDLLERARSYRTFCERTLQEAKRPNFRPKNFEDMLNHGVFLHNRGEFEEALRVLRQAAEIHPRNEHVLYCLAATAARTGDNATALKALRSAIAASPANRAQARSDSDFDPLRDDEEFISLIHPQAS
jgi:tetratricopeptide (TPR) repeat protein